MVDGWIGCLIGDGSGGGGKGGRSEGCLVSWLGVGDFGWGGFVVLLCCCKVTAKNCFQYLINHIKYSILDYQNRVFTGFTAGLTCIVYDSNGFFNVCTSIKLTDVVS